MSKKITKAELDAPLQEAKEAAQVGIVYLCPHCRGENIYFCGGTSGSVKCADCGMMGPHGVKVLSLESGDHPEALLMWNQLPRYEVQND